MDKCIKVNTFATATRHTKQLTHITIAIRQLHIKITIFNNQTEITLNLLRLPPINPIICAYDLNKCLEHENNQNYLCSPLSNFE